MPDPPGERVSTIELFFDLVFVFTITQLTSLQIIQTFEYEGLPERGHALPRNHTL